MSGEGSGKVSGEESSEGSGEGELRAEYMLIRVMKSLCPKWSAERTEGESNMPSA